MQHKATINHLRKGSRDDAVVRALASHQCGPGSGLGVRCGLSLLLFSSLLREVFLWGTPVYNFPLSSKANISKFLFDQDTVEEEPPCGCATANSHLFIYLFIYFIILFTPLRPRTTVSVEPNSLSIYKQAKFVFQAPADLKGQ